MNTLLLSSSTETNCVQTGSLHDMKSPCTRDPQQSNASQMNKPKENTIVETSDQKEIGTLTTESDKASGVPNNYQDVSVAHSEDFQVSLVANKESQDVSIELNNISQEASMTHESENTTSIKSEVNINSPMENGKTNIAAQCNIAAQYVKNVFENNTSIEPEASCNSQMGNSTTRKAVASTENSTTNNETPITNEPENSTASCESVNNNLQGKTLHGPKRYTAQKSQ